MKKYELAIEDLNVVIKRCNNHAQAYYLRGACKDALHDYDGACRDMQKAASFHYQEAVNRVKKYCN